jgi:saccharopine dehydrogenase-like NADP-dependent oxidoreductase
MILQVELKKVKNINKLIKDAINVINCIEQPFLKEERSPDG